MVIRYFITAHRRPIVGALVWFFIVLILVIQIERVPPLWWDEGWTLAVARNWVVDGHYGQLLDGMPQGPGLSAASSVVAPIALSFKLFKIWSQ